MAFGKRREAALWFGVMKVSEWGERKKQAATIERVCVLRFDVAE